MGIVYRAEDTRLGRSVALKFLTAEFARDTLAHERFQREARAASALDHPNICAVYDIGEHDGLPYIVLPLLEGRTLRAMIGDKPLPNDRIVDLALQVANGLAAAHARGILHRDVKSSNIFVTGEGLAKILDFGLAKQTEPVGSSPDARTIASVPEDDLTVTGVTLGTLAYMSPEQVRGDDLDARSDLFSLGVVLYEMATARQPFQGRTSGAVSAEILTKTPEPPRSLNATLPESLERVTLKLLEKDPDRRYQTADEVADALRTLRGGSIPSGALLGAGKLRRRLGGAALAGLTLAAAIWWFAGPFSPGPAPRPGSVAVLPFANLSSNPDNEYFVDGLTDSIIAQLSKIGGLTVISRTSVARYKTRERDLSRIGEELGVASVLEGSVQRDEERFSISAKLIDPQTGRHLWADTYQPDYSRIFAIQNEVALRIASALRVRLSREEMERIERRPTDNLSAYDYYLKGEDYYHRFRQPDNETAIELFKKALSLDPDFALARAGLADAYFQRWQRFGFGPDWIQSSQDEAERAVASDPRLAEAYKALGNALSARGLFGRAIDATAKAIEFNPNYADAVNNIGVYYSITGQMAKALTWVEKAVQLDPISADGYATVGAAHYYLGNDAEAEVWLRKALELEPDNILAHFNRGEMYLFQGEDEAALREARKILEESSDETSGQILAGAALRFLDKEAEAAGYFQQAPDAVQDYHNNRVSLAGILWSQGRRADAKRLLDAAGKAALETVQAGSESPYPRYTLSQIHAIRGEREEAYHWLDEAIQRGWVHYRWTRRDPAFESFRKEAPFQTRIETLKRMLAEQLREASRGSTP